MTRTVLLGDIAGIQTGPFGSQLHQEDYVQDGTPIVTVEHLGQDRMTTRNLPKVSVADVQRLSKYTLTEGDTVFSRVGSVDRASYVHKEENGWMFSGRCLRVRPDSSKVNPRFLSFQLRSPAFTNYIKSVAVGATMPSINTKLLSSAPVKLPERDEQDRIAEILDAIETKIELNRKMNETLEQMGQALFRHYFIDNPKADKWKGGVLEDILSVTMGQSPPGSSYNTSSEGIVFFQGRAEFGKRFPNKRLSTIDPKRLAKRGDVLLSVRAPVGDINQATEDCCIGRGLAAISSSDGFESYCYYLMKHIQPRFADFNSEGTVFGAINGKQLKELKITIPPRELRQEFNDTAKSIDAQIWNNSEQIQTLTTLRDTLLPRLINGKVKLN